MDSLFAVLDHLVYVTPDVDKTIEDLSAQLGVSAVPGGQHPAWGTRNALLALGSRMYLEIMGPDPTLPRPALQRPFGIDNLYRARLATWVCRSDDLQHTVEVGRHVGVDLGEVKPGQRTRPDGTKLSWTMTDLMKSRENGMVPYFIDWGTSRHPAEDAPAGCILKQLRAQHPKPNHLNSILKAFDLDLQMDHGRGSALIAIVQTKHGLVEIF
jgi:hypothetical protein